MDGFGLMELPEELKIRGILTQGGAFRAKLASAAPYPRYYFVLNRDPVSDSDLVLLTSTTQFELHRNCDGGDDVHIPLRRAEYKEFTRDCLVCCNRPRIIKKAELVRRLNLQKYELLVPLPSHIAQRIAAGIAKSSLVPPAVKEMVLGPQAGKRLNGNRTKPNSE
ncbi:MAG: hypothetical protein JXN61_13210 [Sedimentisphaerales bacterium]|nr:hypothetical protein [Sedimentisphaerales bacterium]